MGIRPAGGDNGSPRASAPATPVRRILALGGHDFSSRPPDRAICELLLRLAGERGGGRPKICILPTASGDTSEQIGRFYAAFGERSCEPSDVSLFRLGRRPMALRDHLLSQDLVYVGGGSLVNLLAVWEAHDIASILSLAWRRGIVLAGQSAGAMCWFESGITKSSGKPREAAGLGLLPGSLCVHYNNQPERRAAYLEAIGDGMPDGYGLDDYAGLLWEGESAPSAVTARRGARAYRVCLRNGAVAESPLPARFLPAPAPAALRQDIAEYRRLKTMRKRAGWLG
ncbi:MAG TPA: peptidase E [Solirubrobacterales bacterium]|jgi:peptidase E